MSTIQSTTQPTPTPPPSDNGGGSRLLPLAIVALLALAGATIYLFMQNRSLSTENTEIASQLDNTEQLKTEVEQQYYESLTELEEMKGTNAELNEMIDAQKAEIMEAKTRIDGLLRDKRNLGAARQELADLKEQTAKYVAEIQQLREENELLAEENQNLSTTNEGLSRNLGEATAANEELSAARAALVSEKEVLLEENSSLANTVTMASVVKVDEIDVTGLRMKDSGKTARKKYAKNVDLLEVCFETTQNDVTTPGDEEFYVRIISPLGETLAVEEMGSGTIENALTKEQVRYTKVATSAYTNDVNQVCMTWDTPVQLSKGDYGVEVYNKGYLAGLGTFRLK